MLQTINDVANSLAPSGTYINDQYSTTYVSNSISNNSVTVSSDVSGYIYGAITVTAGSPVVVNNDGDLTGNCITVNSGIIGAGVSGAYTNRGSVINNKVIINGGTINNFIIGGYSDMLSAIGNNVIINSGTINGCVAGGVITDNAYWGSRATKGNSVTINGGIINGNVYGGMINADQYLTPDEILAGIVAGNTVTISGNPVFGASVNIYGSYHVPSTYYFVTPPGIDVFTGNTLNVYDYSNSSIIGSIQNFQYYNFIFPASQVGPVLSVSSATLGNGMKGSIVTVAADTSSRRNPLNIGYSVTLIEATTSLVPNGFDQTQATGLGLHGIALRYNWDISIEGNDLIAIFTGTDTNPQTKILSEGVAAGAILAREVADNIEGRLLSNLQDGKIEAVASVSGDNSKYDTGSSVKMNSFGGIAGVAKKFNATSAGIFAEYTSGNFDTDYKGLKGSGNATAAGAGLVVRREYKDDVYFEGLVRGGQLTNDYKNKLSDISGQTADFNYNSTYLGLGLAIGQILKLSNKVSIDCSGKYALTSIASSDAQLATGEEYEMNSITSNRIKAGLKGEYAMSGSFKPYLAVSYDYELSGDVNAKVDGYDIEAPTLNGGTITACLGLNGKIKDKLTLDLVANIYSGVRQGAAGNLQVKYQF